MSDSEVVGEVGEFHRLCLSPQGSTDNVTAIPASSSDSPGDMMEEEMTTIESMRGALRDSKELVKMKDEQITVLKSDALDLQKQVQEARAGTVSVQETLQFENRALQLELHEVKQKSDMYTRQLDEEMLHLKNEVTKSQEVIRKKDCMIQELTQAQTQNLTVMQELKDARHNDQETVKTQAEQITVLKSDALDLQKQVQEARAGTVSVQETLQSENRALQLELHEVKEKSDTSVRELEEEVLSLNTEIREYQEAVRERDSVIRELTHTQIQNQTLMEVLRNALHDSQETVKSQNQQIAVLESDVQDVQKQVQEAWAETVSVQETLQSAERAFQLELCEERQREERSYTYTRELEKKILTLKVEIRECQDAIREQEITIQELTHFESLAESKDAEIKELRAALCSSKDNEVSLTGQNISLIEEVARLEAQTDKQNGKIENLKEAVRALQHQIVEAESFIWTKDELLTKQTSEIAGLKELTEELLLHISDLKQSNSDLKTQLDTRQEEEILAGVSFREECRSLTENFDQLDVAEEQAAPAAEAPTVEAPNVEAPTVEAPNVEAPAVEAPEVEAPAVEGQSSSWWRRCARVVQKVGLCVGITAVRVLVPLGILASYSICSSGTDFSPLAPYYNIEHITPPPF